MSHHTPVKIDTRAHRQSSTYPFHRSPPPPFFSLGILLRKTSYMKCPFKCRMLIVQFEKILYYEEYSNSRERERESPLFYFLSPFILIDHWGYEDYRLKAAIFFFMNYLSEESLTLLSFLLYVKHQLPGIIYLFGFVFSLAILFG